MSHPFFRVKQIFKSSLVLAVKERETRYMNNEGTSVTVMDSDIFYKDLVDAYVVNISVIKVSGALHEKHKDRVMQRANNMFMNYMSLNIQVE